uniref:ZN692 protein n=1 Tax=Aquila chrysaetos chrysaetos TaxID=223781 RepID=A0A663EHE3_AQUCH
AASSRETGGGAEPSAGGLSPPRSAERRQSLDRRRGKTRIYVGNHIDRWLTLKEKLDFRNDAEVAGFLLDFGTRK